MGINVSTISAVSCFSEGLKPVDSTFTKIFFYSWTPGFLWLSYWAFSTIWDPFELQALYLAVSPYDALIVPSNDPSIYLMESFQVGEERLCL